MLVSRSSPFGGKTRTLVLVVLSVLEESFPREMARVLEVPLNGIQQAIRGLEADGIVSGRTAGRTRLFRLNPRYFALKELQAYLLRLAEPETRLARSIAALRRRPGRTGKP